MTETKKKFKKHQIVYIIENDKPKKYKFITSWNEYSCAVLDSDNSDWTVHPENLFLTAEEAIDNHIDNLILKLVELINRRENTYV